MKKIVLLAAFLSSFFALLNLFFVFKDSESLGLWISARIIAAIFIISEGILTWRCMQAKAIKPIYRELLLLSAMGLIALGAAGIPLAYHFGVVTGDFEYYLFPIHILLMEQGALTIWELWRETQPLTAA